MLASTALGINRTHKDDWFDTILDVDTELFIDPFTIFKEATGPWKVAHGRLVGHFSRAFILIAEGDRNPTSTAYKKALALLEFKEPHELCLGYAAEGTRGSVSSGRPAELMAEAIAAAIDRGLEHPGHFEELGVLQDRIGADRISDATCTILKPELIAYTQKVTRRHGVALDLTGSTPPSSTLSDNGF